MQSKEEQKKKMLLDEKIKAIPIEQQNYIKGLIDGVLMSVTKKGGVKQLGGQTQ